MPLEVKINFDQGVIKLPDIRPGIFAILPSSNEDKIAVVSCNANDDGGEIGTIDPDNIEYIQGRTLVKPENVETISCIEQGGVHRDFIQLSREVRHIPLLIGELVIQHV